MTRVAWATDLHLNHADSRQLDAFRREVHEAEADLLVVSGDVSESIYLFSSLNWLNRSFAIPIYFCLGNHDFYYDSIYRMRESCAEFCEDKPDLTYLTVNPPIELASDVGLLGHDGWADGRVPDYETSVVTMHDSRLIEEFSELDKQARWGVMKQLADESSEWLRAQLPAAVERWQHVLLVTHVPPLHEACWYNGGLSDRHWAPHFVNLVFGETLLEIMRDHPARMVTVLCGHTHGEGTTKPLPNVTIHTGRANYGSPCLARIFDVGRSENDCR